MKVSIIGKAQGWDEAPKDGETWGLTQLNLRRPVSLVIDMNDYTLWGPIEAVDANLSRKKADKEGVPYIDRDNYPLAEITERYETDYFNSTIDYAIALALLRGFTEIDLWGIVMALGTEYAHQKPGVEFWCGIAIGSGVRVAVHGGLSVIMKTRDGKLYGYGTPQKRRIS